jgi:hypothetical protein
MCACGWCGGKLAAGGRSAPVPRVGFTRAASSVSNQQDFCAPTLARSSAHAFPNAHFRRPCNSIPPLRSHASSQSCALAPQSDWPCTHASSYLLSVSTSAVCLSSGPFRSSASLRNHFASSDLAASPFLSSRMSRRRDAPTL